MAQSGKSKRRKTALSIINRNETLPDILELSCTGENYDSPARINVGSKHTNYMSPLRHLGKTNMRKSLRANLDDSIVVLHEIPPRTKRKLDDQESTSKSLKSMRLDCEDSVIIVSDSELDASDNETMCLQTIQQQSDSSKQNQSCTEIITVDETPVRKKRMKNSEPARKSFSPHLIETIDSYDDNTGLCQEIKRMDQLLSFMVDTHGDTSNLHLLNAKNKQQQMNSQAKRKAEQNPNWARFSNSNFINNQTMKNCRVGSYYNSETVVKPQGSLRDIVVDGCNVAMAYTHNKMFSEAGIQLVIDYFKMRGHNVKVFVPQHMRSMKHVLLEKLYTAGIVVFTPSRCIAGKKIVSYDDRYILDYATMCDGIVVSQDQYRDMWLEKPAWRQTIEKRLLVPTFVDKCVMFPEDPLGRDGPKLDEFLRH